MNYPVKSNDPLVSTLAQLRPYQSGFGNAFATEAVAGALPDGQNSPQRPPFGLYAEQLSGSAFTAPRRDNLRSWLYRLRPTASHAPFALYRHAGAEMSAADAPPPTPNRLRWDPFPIPQAPTDFLDGLFTLATNGDVATGSGLAVHVYSANRSMTGRVFFDADGELLIVPQLGALTLVTELGVLDLRPGEIAVIPRGVRFRVDLEEASARGYVCENHGAPLRLPELGPLGSNGLANARDFLAPVAAFEDIDQPVEIVQKFHGRFWSSTLDHSPFDVVAWHGNLTPYKYDLDRFNTVGSISYDHPDPSIFTVLTSPSEIAGVANVDFVIFPPRWLVAEHTFRPPWFHRNIMSEFMGLIHGAYDAKADGFAPGGASLHNCMAGHGPDLDTWTQATEAVLQPQKVAETMAFMFESRWVFQPTRGALQSAALQAGYDACWDGFPKARI